MRGIFFLLATGLAGAQTMTEVGASAAGSAIGSAAGKKVSEGISAGIVVVPVPPHKSAQSENGGGID